MKKNTNQSESTLKVVRASLGAVSLYEISEYELLVLEGGAPSSTYCNFAIFFGATGLSFLIALITVKLENHYVFTIFSIISAVGISLFVILLTLWYKSRSPINDVCKKIRSRLPAIDDAILDDENVF